MNDRLKSALSLGKKAGKLILGFDVMKEAVAKKTSAVVLTASDLSPKTRKEVLFVTAGTQTVIYTLPYTMDELWFIVGKRCGVIAVSDPGFAGMILKNMPSGQTEEQLSPSGTDDK